MSIVCILTQFAVQSHDSCMEMIAASLAWKGPGFKAMGQLAKDQSLKELNSFVPCQLCILVQELSMLGKCAACNAQPSRDFPLGDIAMMQNSTQVCVATDYWDHTDPSLAHHWEVCTFRKAGKSPSHRSGSLAAEARHHFSFASFQLGLHLMALHRSRRRPAATPMRFTNSSLLWAERQSHKSSIHVGPRNGLDSLAILSKSSRWPHCNPVSIGKWSSIWRFWSSASRVLSSLLPRNPNTTSANPSPGRGPNSVRTTSDWSSTTNQVSRWIACSKFWTCGGAPASSIAEGCCIYIYRYM